MTKPPLVLVIDDEPAIILSISFRLQTAGCRVVAALDGTGGLDTAVETHPELILLDRRLPDADGLDVLTQLKAEDSTRNVPVVLMSGRNDDRGEALATGAAEFLAKPFAGWQIVELLHRFVPAATPA